MPGRSLALTLLVLVVVLVPGSASAQGLLASERYSLDNGLDVVLHVDRRLPLVAVDLTYHVGWAHDAQRRGLAHLVEHLMFRGTRHTEDGEYFARLQRVGALATNASTDSDQTSYHTLVPREQVALALWLESDRMAHLLPAITDRKVQQEIGTTIDEWESRVQTRVHGLAHEALWNALFPPEHPFHRAGPRQIKRLSSADVVAQVERYHGPANATLVLAGDLPDDVRAQVERYFGRRRGGQRPQPIAPQRRLAREHRIAREAEVGANPYVAVGWLTPGLYEPGDAEADVLAAYLDEARLQAMAERHAPGTILDLEVRQVSMVGQSVFVLAARGTSAGMPLAMLQTIDAILTEVREVSLEPHDVVRARKHYTMLALRSLQRIDARARRIQLYVAAGKEPGWHEDDLARYDAVDSAGVSAFVRESLVPDRRVVVLSYPPEDRAASSRVEGVR